LGVFAHILQPDSAQQRKRSGRNIEDEVLRNRRDQGKIVLPCRPKFPRRDKSFFRAHLGAASISVQAIRWTPI
jgi:hypothetical protein